METRQLLGSIVRSLKPSQIRELIGIIDEVNEGTKDDLLRKISCPLETTEDTLQKKEFFNTQLNESGGIHRSPYTNKYYPESEQYQVLPSDKIRSFEKKAQLLFELYVKLYYEAGLVNTFFYEKEDNNLAGVIAIRRIIEDTNGVKKGQIDTINYIDIKMEPSKRKTYYKAQSTMFTELTIENEDVGELNLSFQQQKNEDQIFTYNKADDDEVHLQRIGKLIESVENSLNNSQESVLLTRTKEIISKTRLKEHQKEDQSKALDLTKDLFSQLKRDIVSKDSPSK